jgi:hypothetical protein
MAESISDGTLQQLESIFKNDYTIIAEHGVSLEKMLKDHTYK